MQPNKKGYARAVFLAQPGEPKYCRNCGKKIKRKKVYCDPDCQKEHTEKLKRERRPKDIKCAFCNTELDPMSRQPYSWRASELHFCDNVCVDAYRREHEVYKKISEKGNKSIKQHKETYGRPHNYENRSARTSENNKVAPPRSKVKRVGQRVWGYDVSIIPNAQASGYIGYIPDIPDIIVEAKTAKEVLALLRLKFVESRRPPQAQE